MFTHLNFFLRIGGREYLIVVTVPGVYRSFFVVISPYRLVVVILYLPAPPPLWVLRLWLPLFF